MCGISVTGRASRPATSARLEDEITTALGRWQILGVTRAREAPSENYAAALRRYAVSRVSANTWRSILEGTVFASRLGISGFRL